MPDVVVCGNLTLDDVVAADGAATMGVPGGNVLHAALGARLWTPSVGLVTRAGEDAPELSAAGALDGVVRVDGPTVRCWVLYEADGRRVEARAQVREPAAGQDTQTPRHMAASLHCEHTG